MTAAPGEKRRALVPGTDVEVVRWTSPAGDGGCTVTWLRTERLDLQAASTEVTSIERQRAAGFTRSGDRRRSLGSAWLMRRLVACSVDVAPLGARIVRRCPRCATPHGRPVVADLTRDGQTLHVSATHSGGLVGVALSTSGPVGLDLEDLQARGPGAWAAVWRVLGRPDVPGAAAGPEAAREAAAAWVRTEALLKATGQGLEVSPREVDISAGAEPVVTRWPWGDPLGRVSVFDLSPGGRYAAALAAIHDEPGHDELSHDEPAELATATGQSARTAD